MAPPQEDPFQTPLQLQLPLHIGAVRGSQREAIHIRPETQATDTLDM